MKYLIILFVFVVIIIIVILIVINYNLIKKLPRKKRANELEDTYEYLEQSDKIGKSKLIN
jgi:predicted membrane protein